MEHMVLDHEIKDVLLHRYLTAVEREEPDACGWQQALVRGRPLFEVIERMVYASRWGEEMEQCDSGDAI